MNKDWNNALDKAIDIIKENLGINNLTNNVIQEIKKLKIYEN